jgi:hypothetical protein
MKQRSLEEALAPYGSVAVRKRPTFVASAVYRVAAITARVEAERVHVREILAAVNRIKASL